MKFLADGMLGRFTRWLRLLGYDVVYEPDTTDETLINTAKEDGRILLTSDLDLYRRAVGRGVEAYFVDVGEEEAIKLSRFSKRFGASLRVRVESSRCPTCNSLLKRVEWSAVKDKIPQETLKRYREFWTCTNGKCGKVYWQGSHWRMIDQTLKAARSYLENV
ncbi:MAG: Mut7-C RNAse domain-containing protein [Candidatus Bathyarchaeia archaeon]